MNVASLDTPVATVDLDAVERNIARMQGYCDEHGLAFRPHIKTHKLPAIAHMQMRAGAVGITCQKLGEAEVGFLVECDTGFGRTGVQTPQAAADLAELVHALPGLRFDGLMTYPTLPGTGPWLRAAIDEIQARGLPVATVSGGGTPTFFSNHEVPEVTEVRAGTYVYGDRSCIANGSVPLEDCALRVRATVASRPTPERGILDCGSKTLTNDPAEGADGGPTTEESR